MITPSYRIGPGVEFKNRPEDPDGAQRVHERDCMDPAPFPSRKIFAILTDQCAYCLPETEHHYIIKCFLFIGIDIINPFVGSFSKYPVNIILAADTHN